MLFEKRFPSTLKKKFLVSPRLCLRKKSSLQPQTHSDDDVMSEKAVDLGSLTALDRSKSAEDLRKHQIDFHSIHRPSENSLQPDHPHPVLLGNQEADHHDNHYHNSQEFLNFLTSSARAADEQEQTINAALAQVAVLRELISVNQQLLQAVKKCTPSEDDVFFRPGDVTIDKDMMRLISGAVHRHSVTVKEMTGRSKGYHGNTALAETDLYTGREVKRDLVGIRRSLLEMTHLLNIGR